MIRELLMKTFIPVSRILIINFSIFYGNAPVVKTSCKRNINFKKINRMNPQGTSKVYSQLDIISSFKQGWPGTVVMRTYPS